MILIKEEYLLVNSIYFEEKNSVHQLYESIYESMSVLKNRELVIVCIGTDRSSGDSLGPLVGTKLTERKLQYFKVYGTLENPVHALNLEETIKSIKNSYRNPFIIAVDACLGRRESVGQISYIEGPILPGAAMKKSIPPTGDAHIAGIVNVGGNFEFMVIQNTRLYTVMKMADVISRSIILTDYMMRKSAEKVLQ